VLARIRSVAPTKTTVLLTGETGTGKGVLARLIHRLSQRHEHPFVAVHCAAIPDALLESELFGYEKGAFTGAERRKAGRFEIARGGTLFLDEISTLTPSTQVKLLQVLQERTFQRLGGVDVVEADVRIIAAANEDLESAVEEGRLRRDLYYRLSVFPLEIPALRDRIEDLPLLAAGILDRHARAEGAETPGIDAEVLEGMTSYAWPGNIRELENLLERARILEAGESLTRSSFPAEIFAPTGVAAALPVDTGHTLAEVRRAAADAAERTYLIEVLSEHAGRIGLSAKAAGITPRQLHNLMTKHGLQKESFRGS
jgi:transcriptional regulator with GAF, ATPase, and Fis domain